jgi:hypothetical protein
MLSDLSSIQISDNPTFFRFTNTGVRLGDRISRMSDRDPGLEFFRIRCWFSENISILSGTYKFLANSASNHSRQWLLSRWSQVFERSSGLSEPSKTHDMKHLAFIFWKAFSCTNRSARLKTSGQWIDRFYHDYFAIWFLPILFPMAENAQSSHSGQINYTLSSIENRH